MRLNLLALGLVTAGLIPPVPAGEPEVPVRRIAPGVDPANLVIHDGRLYASGFHAGRVSSVDLLTGKKLGECPLDAYERATTEGSEGEKAPAKAVHPYAGGCVVRAAGKVFAAQLFSDTLLAIDPGSMRVVRRLPLGDGLLAAAPDGKAVVLARTGKDEFRLVDVATYGHVTVPYPEGGHGVSAVAVSPDGRLVVLGVQRGGQPAGGRAPIERGNCFLAVYDLARKKYVATVYLASSDTESVSEFVGALAFAPDGRALYAGMFQAETGVRMIDTTKWELVGDIRFEPNERNKYFRYTNPLGLAFSHGLLYVANRENQEAVVVEPGAREPLARLRFAGGKHEIHRAVADGDRIYLADQEAVYELDGWSLARRLARPAEGGGRPPPDLMLKVKPE